MTDPTPGTCCARWFSEGSLLDASFCAVPGIGLGTEQRLWTLGVTRFAALHEVAERTAGLRHRAKEIRACIERSISDPPRRTNEFAARLRKLGQAWRLYDAHRDDAVYIDIETTGLSPRSSKITLIGTVAGGDFRCFRTRADMRRAARYLRQFRLAVTFNGDAFDLRFLDAAFATEELPPLHWDVRWALWRAGYKGTLNDVEGQLGIGRAGPLAMLTGFDAVPLWHEYQRGNRRALNILVEKLRADASSLPTLAAHAFNAYARQMPFPVTPAPTPVYVPRAPRFTVEHLLQVLPWKASTAASEVAGEIDADPTIVDRMRDKPSSARQVYWLVTLSRHFDDSVTAYGKWLVFVPRGAVDRAWAKIVGEMQIGELGRWALGAKVSTMPNPHSMRPSEHVICVYVRRDRAARLRVREVLECLRLTKKAICFKTEAATRAGKYSARWRR